MNIAPLHIKNWHGIGFPPDTAFEQFSELWHIELVLRHFAYTSLRLKYGNNWQNTLKLISVRKVGNNKKDVHKSTLYDELQRRAKSSISNKEFTKETVPDLLWFTTITELIDIITKNKNWGDCFGYDIEKYHISREEFIKRTEPLSKQRNRWAHFRPLSPEESSLKNIVKYLEKPFSSWMAYDYWNADPINIKDSVISRYEQECPNGLPVAKDTHGIYGFIDKNKPLDRGFSILITENKAQTCWWVKIYNVGSTSTWSAKLIESLAIKLKDSAIHIALNYDSDVPKESIKDKAFEDVSISFSKTFGTENLIQGLKLINECLEEKHTAFRVNT